MAVAVDLKSQAREMNSVAGGERKLRMSEQPEQ